MKPEGEKPAEPRAKHTPPAGIAPPDHPEGLTGGTQYPASFTRGAGHPGRAASGAGGSGRSGASPPGQSFASPRAGRCRLTGIRF